MALFSAGPAKIAGDVIADVSAIAWLTPLALYVARHRDDIIVTFTLAELAAFGGLMFTIIKIVHYTRPGPGPRARNHTGID
jgi:hypothetical protein